ncbi:MAG: glycosyltransferase [Anaerolineae bacterium]|nr:glycosyltransferase [Anaerolineae bacterium]
MQITIMAIGSRGDVQPLVALGLGLQRAGHEVRLVAGDEFESLAVQYGLPFVRLGVNIREAMQATRDIFRFMRGITGNVLSACRDGDGDAIMATALGERIRAEDGVGAAVKAIGRYLA